jgi:hypothetical protein
MYRPPSSSASGSNPLLDVESTIRGLTQDFCMQFNTGNYDQAGAERNRALAAAVR